MVFGPMMVFLLAALVCKHKMIKGSTQWNIGMTVCAILLLCLSFFPWLLAQVKYSQNPDCMSLAILTYALFVIGLTKAKESIREFAGIFGINSIRPESIGNFLISFSKSLTMFTLSATMWQASMSPSSFSFSISIMAAAILYWISAKMTHFLLSHDLI